MLLNELKCIEENINIEEYLKHYEMIKSTLINKEWLGNFNYEGIKTLLNNEGKIWIFYLKNEIVCSMMYIPASENSLKTFEIKEDVKDIGECGPIMVNPKYVGNGLQCQMLELLDNYCKKINKKMILTTIHPENLFSINNFIKIGYKYKSSFKFKRGDRDLYIKNI